MYWLDLGHRTSQLHRPLLFRWAKWIGRADGVTVFPSGITVAATWDSDLMYERAVAIGGEFRDKGSHVHLGYDRTTLCNVQLPSELTIA
jgi:beta-glucosidase-like glycosyl hydrolase